MKTIYYIKNKKNNKLYIGQTKTSLKERFKEHVKCSKNPKRNNRPLYLAFNKHGIQNFEIDILEQCENCDINERETYYIKKYNTYGRNGYNATKGGEGNQTLRFSDQEIISKYQELKNITHTKKFFNIKHSDTIKSILKRNNILICNENSHISLKRKIVQMSLEGTELNCFDSIIQAVKHLKKNENATSNISECCRGNRKQAFGYKWKYIDTEM